MVMRIPWFLKLFNNYSRGQTFFEDSNVVRNPKVALLGALAQLGLVGEGFFFHRWRIMSRFRVCFRWEGSSLAEFEAVRRSKKISQPVSMLNGRRIWKQRVVVLKNGNLIFELLLYHPEILKKSIPLIFITQQEFVSYFFMFFFSRLMFVTRFEKGALQKLWLHLGSLQYNEAVSGEQL